MTLDIEGNCETTGADITCKSPPLIPNIIHEFGHTFDNRYKAILGRLASDQVQGEFLYTAQGYACFPSNACLSHAYTPGDLYYGLYEEFANMYENLVLSGLVFDNVPYGFVEFDIGGLAINYRELWMLSGLGSDTYKEKGIPYFLTQMGFR